MLVSLTLVFFPVVLNGITWSVYCPDPWVSIGHIKPMATFDPFTVTKA